MVFLMFLLFFLLLFLRFPIAFSLGISTLVYLIAEGYPLITLPLKMYSGIDVFVLLAIPGFILAGNLMNVCGMTDRIIGFCNNLVGHIRGGLSLANIGASMIFSGISGTAISDTASIGSVMIPAMKKEGYRSDFSCAVTAASSTIGPIIPPSLPMIIAGSLTGISVGKLFVAGAIPGLLLAVGLAVVSYNISVRHKHPKQEKATWGQRKNSFIHAFWALLMTFLILFGIIGGIFTPTEASIVAVIYALVIGTFFYKTLTLKNISRVMADSAGTTASLMLLVGFANLFGWILITEQIPQNLAELLLSITQNKILLLLLINCILLIVGTFMETIAALLIVYPILLNVAISVGIDPIHFSVIAVLNLIIGLTTPPVGVCLFVAAGIGKVNVDRVVRAGFPFLVVSLIVLLLVTYVPALSLFLPGLLD